MGRARTAASNGGSLFGGERPLDEGGVDPPVDKNNGPGLGEESVEFIQLGLTVESQGGECRGIHATTPMPIEWPEQSIRIASEDITPNVLTSAVTFSLVLGLLAGAWPAWKAAMLKPTEALRRS